MRIRSTKPEFWRSRRVAEVSWDARLVLKGLESYVDDNGVGKDDLALIVGDIFPRDLVREPSRTLARVSEAISELFEAGLLWRYEHQNTELLFIAFWESIQRIDKPGAGRYPRPDGTYNYKESEIRESSRDSRESSRALAPGTGEQGNRGTGEELLAAAPPPRAERPRNELFEAVAEVCGIDWQNNLTDMSKGPLVKAVKEIRAVGASPDDVRARAAQYRKRFRDATLTPTALAKHWASLTPPAPQQQAFDPLASARPRGRS